MTTIYLVIVHSQDGTKDVCFGYDSYGNPTQIFYSDEAATLRRDELQERCPYNNYYVQEVEL